MSKMNSENNSLQPLNSLDFWDYTIELECLQGTQDLQLAAELGKTLLERNKELETSLKQHQTVIEDQTQEIEYLTKQTVALREVNDSRLRIYEQLEVSIQDLERANHRLVLDNSAGKKHIKILSQTIENLETKCEELQTTIDDLRLEIDILKRRSQKIAENQNYSQSQIIPIRYNEVYGDDNYYANNNNNNNNNNNSNNNNNNNNTSNNNSNNSGRNKDCNNSTETQKNNVSNKLSSKSHHSPSKKILEYIEAEKSENENTMEQMSQLLVQLRETKSQSIKDQRKITELEEQLATVLQQNQALENQVIQLHHRDDDTKSMHEEFNTLEEVRKGQMCSRCLRNVERNDENILEDDDSSMLNELMATPQCTSISIQVQDYTCNQLSPLFTKPSGNLYKDLVQKYEALLEVQRQPVRNQTNLHKKNISLQEELQISGDFNTIKDTDEESGNGDSLKPTILPINQNINNKKRLIFSHTPTDFSEAETSSSGFSDETSNKFTQTEERPGSFLCTIADGDDCKFSIYDDASPIASRFRNRPEYQELFKEIFSVLKNAADKDTDLPLVEEEKIFSSLTDTRVNTCNIDHHTMPDSEQNSELIINDDDTQSVLSSTISELSVCQTESMTNIENIQSQNELIPEPKSECILRPLIRQPLEYISVEVRKRSSSRRKNKHHSTDRSDSPIVTQIIGSPKISYSNRTSRRRRDFKVTQSETDYTPPTATSSAIWNGSTLHFWSSNNRIASPTPSQGSGNFEFKPSSASQDLHKLKKLDLSYAEVLRNADNKKKLKHRRK